MSNNIFVSYRREDSRGSAGRLYDQLAAHFGRERIFMDVDTIEPGVDFVNVIESAVSETDIQIVVIGPNWLNSTDAVGNRRLENPEDFVRLEIASALKRNIRVIPVLVDKAIMPSSFDLPDDLKLLARRNAFELSHSRFNIDIQRLIPFLENALQQAEEKLEEESIQEPNGPKQIIDVHQSMDKFDDDRNINSEKDNQLAQKQINTLTKEYPRANVSPPAKPKKKSNLLIIVILLALFVSSCCICICVISSLIPLDTLDQILMNLDLSF